MKIKLSSIIISAVLLSPIRISGQVSNLTTQNQTHQTFQNLTCKTCHDCDIPTKENPCLIKCPRDFIATVTQKPENSPNTIMIDRLKNSTDIYNPVIFKHQAHAEMAEMSGGCSSCHHYNPPGSVVGCIQCHKPNRATADLNKPDLKGAYHRLCMNCHREWSGEVECNSCHESKNKSVKTRLAASAEPTRKRIHPVIAVPTRLTFDTPNAIGKIVTFYHGDHVNLFKLDCQNCHSNENCIKCHSKNKTLVTHASLDQHHKICSSCHDTESNSNCGFCHQNKETGPFNHKEKTGFDIAKFHGKLSCERCHTTKGKFTGLKDDCALCHGSWTQENFNHKITGVALDETHSELECDNCHKEKNYSNPVCTDCHDDKSYPKNVPGKRIKK